MSEQAACYLVSVIGLGILLACVLVIHVSRGEVNELVRLARELEATRRAKSENDERFMIERDEARREKDEAIKAQLSMQNYHVTRCPAAREIYAKSERLAVAGKDLVDFIESILGPDSYGKCKAMRDALQDATAPDYCQDSGHTWMSTACKTCGKSVQVLKGLHDFMATAENDASEYIGVMEDILTSYTLLPKDRERFDAAYKKWNDAPATAEKPEVKK